MNISKTISDIKTGFLPTFWVANVIELFERFAFYGSKAVLTVYLATKAGFDVQTAGTMAGTFSLFLWSFPVIAGVFVDRYGFKRTLAACFAFFTIGYFLIGLAGLEYGQAITETIGKTTYMYIVLILTAIGGSLIKPCIVGTVAKTSNPNVQSLGYSIYYTLVNLGGAIGPILALQVREGLGIEYVLIMSSFTSLLLFVGTLFFYKEPQKAADEKPQLSLGKVFRDMLTVFTNAKFILFLVIFSGFWIMFWQIFYSFPFYTTEVLKFPQFEILETVDAWAIILFSVPLTALAMRFSPITAMTIGFLIASSSWLLMVAAPTVTMAVLAMILFAVGESIQAPRFYEYVASLAPKEQVGTYMGFAFLPIAIGSFVAGVLSGWLVETYLRQSMNPNMMWFTLASIGFASTILMLLYNIFIVKRKG